MEWEIGQALPRLPGHDVFGQRERYTVIGLIFAREPITVHYCFASGDEQTVTLWPELVIADADEPDRCWLGCEDLLRETRRNLYYDGVVSIVTVAGVRYPGVVSWIAGESIARSGCAC